MKLLLIQILSSAMFFPLSAEALTLEQSVKAAEENSHELRESQLNVESSEWAERRARASFMPRLDLAGRHLFSEKFEVLELEFGGSPIAMPAIQPYTSLGLTASVEVFSGLRSMNELEAARLHGEAYRLGAKRTEARIRANVRTLFYRALGSQILVDVADQNIQNLETHLRDVKARIRSGVSTKFDALRTEVQLDEARTEKLAAESNVAVTRAKLFEALNQVDDQQPLKGELPSDFSTYEKLSFKVEDIARDDRLAQLRTVEAGERQAKAASAHWLPRVSVFGSQEWYNNTNHSVLEDDNRFKTAYSVGVDLRWNLFDGGASVASQRQAEIAKAIAQERLAQFDQSMPAELEEAKRRLSYNILNFKAKQSSIRKAEEAVRLAQSGVRAGTRTTTEALDAAVDLNRAKAASVKSQIDAIDALGKLELAVGRPL